MSKWFYASLQPDFLTEYHFGGGGSPQVPQPVDNSLELERTKEAHDDQVVQQAKQDAADAKTAATAKGTQLLSSGYDNALSGARSKLGANGLDPNTGYGQQILSLYQSDLDRQRGNADASTVTDPNAVYSPTTYADDYNTVQSTAKTGFQKQLDAFAGNGFANNAIQDSSAQPYLDSIVGDQYNTALKSISAAYARGQLNDAGNSYALGQLGTQKSAAGSKAKTYGDGVLTTDRGKLTDYIKPYQSQLDNYSLGDNIDLGGAQTGLNSLKTGLLGSLQGDITNAVGTTNFFDPDTILAKSASQSGVLNNPSASGFGASSGGGLAGAGSSTDGSSGSLLTTPILATLANKQQLGSTGSF